MSQILSCNSRKERNIKPVVKQQKYLTVPSFSESHKMTHDLENGRWLFNAYRPCGHRMITDWEENKQVVLFVLLFIIWAVPFTSNPLVLWETQVAVMFACL